MTEIMLLSIYLSRISIFKDVYNSITVHNLNIRTYNERCRPKIMKQAEAVGFKLYS